MRNVIRSVPRLCGARWGLVLTTVFILCGSVLADKIVMKNGNTFQGQILEENDNEIVLKMEYGTMSFKKQDIKSVTKGIYKVPKPPPESTPPATPSRTDEAQDQEEIKGGSAEETRLLKDANDAAKARQFERAIALLEKAKSLAEGSREKAVLIDAKIRKIKEKAYVVVEVKITDLFSGHPQDPAVRHDRKTETVVDEGQKKEVEADLIALFQRALAQRGFIPVDKSQVKTKRIQKLRVTYSDTGGGAYFDSSGNVTGYRIEAKCRMDLISATGGSLWSDQVEGITPTALKRGSTRDGALMAIEEQLAGKTFGISQ